MVIVPCFGDNIKTTEITFSFSDSSMISSLAFSDFFNFLDAITTLAPILANSRAAAFPIPALPPAPSTYNKRNIFLKTSAVKKTPHIKSKLTA